jgi:hypothetical protein
MLVITYFGSIITTATVTTLSSISFYIHKQKQEVLRLLVSVCGSSLSVLIIKNLVERSKSVEFCMPWDKFDLERELFKTINEL